MPASAATAYLSKQVAAMVRVARSTAARRHFTARYAKLEAALIAALGSIVRETRDRAAQLLNMLYDRHDWQRAVALTPVITNVGETFQVSVPCEVPVAEGDSLVYFVVAPSFDSSIASDAICTVHDATVKPSADGTIVASLNLGPFPRPGIYDWRAVVLHSDGTFVDATNVTSTVRNVLDSSAGRFIVQPAGLKDERVMEVVVDLHNMQVDEAGHIRQRGTFRSVAKSLPSYRSVGITSLILTGALERDNGWQGERNQVLRPDASPFAVVDRTTPNHMLGGGPEFANLVGSAAAGHNPIRVIVEFQPNVSASRMHRKYSSHLVQTVDAAGRLVAHPGTDGRLNQWEDAALLNYRQLRTWELLIEDITSLAHQGVGGVLLTDCQSLPLIMEPDMDELFRVDSDGVPHYDMPALLEAHVVKQNQEGGFWQTRTAMTYANPLLIKMMRRLWIHFPSFLVLGDAHWGRSACLARSGIVARSPGTIEALAAAMGRRVEKSGLVSPLGTENKEPVARLYQLLMSEERMPAGAATMQLRTLCNALLPFPALLLERAAWAAVDVVTCLPGVVGLFEGEAEGRSYRVALASALQHEIPRIAHQDAAHRRMPRVGSDPNMANAAFTHDAPASRIRNRSDSVNSLPAVLDGAIDLLFPELDMPTRRARQGSFHLLQEDDDIHAAHDTSTGYESTDDEEDLARPMRSIQSWAAAASRQPMLLALGGGTDTRDLSILEAKAQAAIGPEFGFDLRRINAHYMHRKGIRSALPVLRDGTVVPLSAFHRYGKHNNVFTFARHTADEIAVVAVNFNAAISQFWVDCSPLAAMFGADVSESSAGSARAIVDGFGATTDSASTQVLNNPVWEMSDVFKGQAHLRVMTAGEAAYAARVTSLEPYSSLCWLFKRQRVSDNAWISESPDPSHRVTDQAELLCMTLMVSSMKVLQSVFHETPDSSSGQFNPSNCMKDNELVAAASQNLVFSLLEYAIKADSRAFQMQVGPASSTTHRWDPVESRVIEVNAGAPPAAGCALYRVLLLMFKYFSFELGADGLCVERGTIISRATPFVSGHTATYQVSVSEVAKCVRLTLFAITRGQQVRQSDLLAHLLRLAQLTPSGPADRDTAAVSAFARVIIARNNVGHIVFVAPELGKWSTVGGLGVMVDELTVGLASMGARVAVVSPYYHVDRKGNSGYLAADGITYTGVNVHIPCGGRYYECGVHRGRVKGVDVIFLHHGEVFPKTYPSGYAVAKMTMLSVFARGCLEALCQLRILPSVVVTNDWFAGLVPAYARNGFFGTTFAGTKFIHIVHNLDPSYEGRQYPDPGDGILEHIHHLPGHLLVDPFWGGSPVLNPTRAALLCSDTWATVSRSYRKELLESSPLSPLLHLAPEPFAHPNGIPVTERKARLAALPAGKNTHAGAKAELQRKYFGMAAADPSIPLFGFVGRITSQKGVHMILDAVDDVMRETGGRAQFLVGGMADKTDPYGIACSIKMADLSRRHPGRFWADPNFFFTDGPLVNLGADIGLMPSMFEPGGIVQQEFFVAGTPVLAFKTGGLRDTVTEYDYASGRGNGFTFEAYHLGDFLFAIRRAIQLYRNQAVYEALRVNAAVSVIDLSVVCRGWYEEFYRLRRCLIGLPCIRFTWPLGVMNTFPTSVVQVTGSWCDWKSFVPLQYDADRQEFAGEIPFTDGLVHFKFVVDGVWSAAAHLPIEKDASGNVNNVLSVASYHL